MESLKYILTDVNPETLFFFGVFIVVIVAVIMSHVVDIVKYLSRPKPDQEKN